MLIDSIELFHVAMPLVSPWRTAYGEDATIESVLVRMHSGNDAAWSESSRNLPFGFAVLGPWQG